MALVVTESERGASDPRMEVYCGCVLHRAVHGAAVVMDAGVGESAAADHF